MEHMAADWIVEDWLCRYVAYHAPIGGAVQWMASPLLQVVNTLEEGYQRAAEAMAAAKELYGEQLVWIEIETLDRAGQWNAVRRYYAYSFP